MIIIKSYQHIPACELLMKPQVFLWSLMNSEVELPFIGMGVLELDKVKVLMER